MAEDEEWATAERLLLGRTLHLRTLSPLYPPVLESLLGSKATARSQVDSLPQALLSALAPELQSYVNLRLSDGLALMGPGHGRGGSGEDAEDAIDSGGRDAETGDPRPPAKRRRVDVGRVGAVRMGWLSNLVLDEEAPDRSTKGRQRMFAIELEMGHPSGAEALAEQAAKGKGKASTGAAKESDFCHLIFVPPSAADMAYEDATSGTRAPDSGLHFPLLLTKSASVSARPGLADDPISPATNVGRAVVLHALDWLQRRFDCRISTNTSAASVGSLAHRLSEGGGIRRVAEAVIQEARMRSSTEASYKIASEGTTKPVELTFTFPHGDGQPAPDLQNLTLTVPWRTCMGLLEGTPEETPLLPALSHYLETHTSIPLSRLSLSRVGAVGVNLSGSLLKVTPLVDAEEDDELGRLRTLLCTLRTFAA